MRSKVDSWFISPLRDHLGDPKVKDGGDVNEIYASLERNLNFYSEKVLEAAVTMIIEEEKAASFPRIGVCLEICKTAHTRIAAEARRKKAFKAANYDEESRKEANRIITGHVGLGVSVRAADEGWVLALWDFVMENRRLPNGHEVVDIRNAYRDREAHFAEHGVPENCRGLRESMLKRRNVLADMVREADRANQAR